MFRFLKLFLLLHLLRFHSPTTQILPGMTGNAFAKEGLSPFEYSRPLTEENSFSFCLTNYKNAQFLLSVTIQGKKFNLLVDTGSSTTWVNSDLCSLPICKSKQGIKVASKETDKKTAVYYGGEKIEGVPTFEVIDFGGGNTFTSQLLALTDTSYGIFVSANFEGILALSPVSHWHLSKQSIMHSFFETEEGMQKKVSFDLNRQDGSRTSLMTIGDDQEFVKKYNVKFVPIEKASRWLVTLKGITINGVATQFCASSCKAVIDTGSSLVSGPQDDVRTLLEQIKKELSHAKKSNEGPTIGFLIGDREYQITSQDYLLGKSHLSFPKMYNTSNAEELIPGFQSTTILPRSKHKVWVLGLMFISKYPTVFDFENKKLGIGTRFN